MTMRGKPQVERPMPYIRDSFWRGREFTSLAHMQSEGERWCTEVAGRRACRPLEGASPLAVFEAAEKGTLAALPAGEFVLAEWRTAKVGPDIHASVAKVLYSIPWRHIGKTLDVRLTFTMVQFFDRGELVKTHPRKQRGKQTDLADYPIRKSRISCGPPRGAAARPRASGRRARRSSRSSWLTMPSTGCGPPRA